MPERETPELSFTLPEGLLDQIADRVALRINARAADQAESYLDVTDAGEYLRCPASRIYELKAQGRIRYFNDGRRLLFRRADLDACLDVGEPE